MRQAYATGRINQVATHNVDVVPGRTKQRTTRDKNENKIRGIIFKDRDLIEVYNQDQDREDNDNKGNEPRMYGGAEVSSSALKVLRNDPKFMVLDRIDIEEFHTELEKGFTIARWGWMDNDQTENEEAEGGGDENKGTQSTSGEDLDKVLNYANLRATDIPTVSRLNAPGHGTLKQEKAIDKLRETLVKTVEEYKKDNCTSKGEFIKNNLSREENVGIKEIKDNRDNKLVIVCLFVCLCVFCFNFYWRERGM